MKLDTYEAVLEYLAQTAEALEAEPIATVAKQRAAIATAAKDILESKAKYGKALEELKSVKPGTPRHGEVLIGDPFKVPGLGAPPLM